MSCGDTGTTVIKMHREGQFDACMSRVSTCGYACCGFGTLGNFISPFPGEIELAKEQGLSFDHLTLLDQPDGSTRVQCNRPCVGGEFKSIDCAIYPAWIASECGTKFLVADNRKCPIPHNELLETLRLAQDIAIQWELEHPGTLKSMAKDGRDFRAYQPFPYALEFDGTIRPLSDAEILEITPVELLPEGYIAKFTGVELEGYSGRGTPQDQPVDLEQKMKPLTGSAYEVRAKAGNVGNVKSEEDLMDYLNQCEAVFMTNESHVALYSGRFGKHYHPVTRHIKVRLGQVGDISGVPVYLLPDASMPIQVALRG